MDNFFSLCNHLTILDLCPSCHLLFARLKLSEEWASFKRKPPAAWCPCVSTDSGQTHLSPQLQTALKRWFTEHFRVEGGVMKVIQHCLVMYSYQLSQFYRGISWLDISGHGQKVIWNVVFISGAGHSQASWERKLLRMCISHSWQNAGLCPRDSRLVNHEEFGPKQ